MLKIIVATATLLLAANAHATPEIASAPDKYSFDKHHTHIIFFISHLGYSYTIGRIKEFDGYFTFDPNHPESSEVDVTLNPASIDTSVPALNKVLVGEKFFNVAKYPTMHFKSANVAVTGANTGTVIGNLTLLAATRPLTLQVTYNKSAVDPITNNYTSGFSIESRFKRSDFGMTAYLPDIGDEVIAHIEVEGIDPAKHPGAHDKKASE